MSIKKQQPISNAAVVDKCTQRLTALKQYVQAKAEIPIDGETKKLADVIAVYQTCLDTRASLQTKHAEIKAGLVERANAEASRRAADRALKPWVINTFGANSQAAHDFGFPPPKVPVRTAKSKVAAVLQAEATRKARHTMGSVQKQNIKGAIVVSTAPAAPAYIAKNGGDPKAIRAAGAAHVEELSGDKKRLPWHGDMDAKLASFRALADASKTKQKLSRDELVKRLAIARKSSAFSAPVQTLFQKKSEEASTDEELQALLDEIELLAKLEGE